MVYRRYISYYKYIFDCKEYYIKTQIYDISMKLRDIERDFFKEIKPVSVWYFTPDIEFDEVKFLKALGSISDKSIIRDFKIKILTNKDDIFYFGVDTDIHRFY